MNALEALQAMNAGKIITDEMFQEYRLLDKDEKTFFGEGEDIYRSRKSTGEFISTSEFLTIQQNFTVVEDNK